MAIELQEKGRVRFWAEVGKFTENCQVEYAFNDIIITQGKVQYQMLFVESIKWKIPIHSLVIVV